MVVALGLAGGCSFDPAGIRPSNPPAAPPPPNSDEDLGCSLQCHGDSESKAPPIDLDMRSETSRRGVGAHRRHIDPAPTFHRRVQCNDCHVEPTVVDEPGHMDGDNVAEVTFGEIASEAGVNARWDPDGLTCTVYCHGASLDGGEETSPKWTDFDDAKPPCDTCHGYPPSFPPHGPDSQCDDCHPTIRPDNETFVDPDSHINGTIETTEVVVECDMCHGGGGEPAPPVDLDGNTARVNPGVGAHREHVGPSDEYRELQCAQCHVTVIDVDDPDHMDGDDVAEVIFDGLNPDANYDPDTATCTNVYCHSAAGKSFNDMVWTQDEEFQCDSCHRDAQGGGPNGLSGEHQRHLSDDLECNECHASVLRADRTFVNPNLHVNGAFDVNMDQGGDYDAQDKECSNVACHEAENQNNGADIDGTTDWIDDDDD